MKIEIYDATLREGAQKSGVVFSEYEKRQIVTADLQYIRTVQHGCPSASLRNCSAKP